MKKKAIALCSVLLVIGIAVTGAAFGFAGKEIATQDTAINENSLAEIQNFREELNAEIENDTFLTANEENIEECVCETEELSEFAFKRLIANGDIENTYGAIKDIDGYLDYHILCYATEEDTEYAYENLIADGVIVATDGIIKSEWVELSEQSTTSAKDVGENSWAYQCMSVGGINQKIDSNRTMSKKQKVVVVIDSGINTEHKMFKDRFLYENKKIVGEAIKKTTMISKYKFEDDNGHGSHVAGIICGFTPENVKIIPIKVLNLIGLSEWSAIISAFAKVEEYAKKYDVVCVNYSNSGIEGLYSAVNSLYNKNILVVAGAGNDSLKMDMTGNGYYSADNAIVVSALKKNENGKYEFDSSYSNYGPSIDICAPGTDIRSAFRRILFTNLYVKMTGTSMATPCVSAAVAMLSITMGDYTAETLEAKLYENTKDMGAAGKDDYYGNGMLYMCNF